ncbi:MAG: heat-inducible transcriptional repressor HrcA [Desulfovibrionales bacterium]
MSLSQREIEILATIVEDYIERAAPIGSRTVAKKSSLGLGPASIRNIMADLTEKGYLEQPHTSAGRVPSTAGFRFYVDRLVKVQPLSEAEKQTIKAQLDDTDLELSEVFKRASRLLSSFSKQVSMVLAPNRSAARWKQIEFVMIRKGLVMAILLLQEGIVENKVITVSDEITADDLVKYRNYLNEIFQGKTVSEVRTHLLREMQQARERFNRLYQKALLLARKTFEDDEREMFVDGTVNILDQPEFADMETMREIFKVLEERSKLLELLDKITGKGGIKIVFGREAMLEEFPYCGLVSSAYGTEQSVHGALGIIGPLRMDYAKMVPVVDFTAQMLSNVLKKRH